MNVFSSSPRAARIILLWEAIGRSLRRLGSPQCLQMGFYSLRAALVVLVVIWLGINSVFSYIIWPWVEQYLPHWLTTPDARWAGPVLFGLLSLISMSGFIIPMTALWAGQLTDPIAKLIETEDYPNDPPGIALPTGVALNMSLKFLALSVVCNIFSLLFLLIPGMSVIGFFCINGYLLGREYFEFAAARFCPLPQAHAYYQCHRGIVFVGGLSIAAFALIPLINIATPLFAAALMIHLHKLLSAADH